MKLKWVKDGPLVRVSTDGRFQLDLHNHGLTGAFVVLTDTVTARQWDSYSTITDAKIDAQDIADVDARDAALALKVTP